MRDHRKTAAPTAIGNGGKEADNERDNLISHVSEGNATGCGHDILLWPDQTGVRWGVFIWRDSGGGFEAENLTFSGALVKALRLSRHGALRGARMGFTGDAAAIMDRNTGGCGHA